MFGRASRVRCRVVCLAVVAFVALMMQRDAAAEPRRVVLAVQDDALAGSLEVALSPLGLEVVVGDADLATGSASEQADRLRSTALTHEAVAVVWIEQFGGWYLLSTYASSSGGISSRPLDEGPPYDSDSAVAVAFSIKTLLRESGVIETPSMRSEKAEIEQEDRDERGAGGEGAAPAAEPPEEVVSRTAAQAAVTIEPAVRRSSLTTRSRFWIESGAAFGLAGGDGDRDSHLSAAATYWFAAPAEPLGVSFSVGRWSAMDADHPALDAAVDTVGAGLCARTRHSMGYRVALMPEACVGLHTTNLRGRAINGGVDLSSRHYSPRGEAALRVAGFATSNAALTLSVRSALQVRPALYTWEGETAFEEPRVRLAAGAGVLFAW